MRLEANAHPDEFTTAAYLDGTLGAESVERFERHLARCSRCRSTVVALRDVPAEEEPVPAEILAKAKALGNARPRRALWIGAGAAAAVLLVVLVNGLPGRRSEPPEPLPEKTRYRAVPGGFEAATPSAGAVVSTPEVDFRWSAHEDAERYIVTVTGADGVTVATLRTDGPATQVEWRIPDDVQRPVTFFWTVRAMRGERAVEETRPLPFETR